MKMIKELGSKPYGKEMKQMAIFKCEFCNNEFERVRSRGLKQLSCSSCRGIASGTTHGMSRTRQYSIWRGMKDRCYSPTRPKYHLYGGKGIIVCDKWKTFEGFWEDNKDAYRDDLTIDRKDSSGNYEPDNVRWIPQAQNSSETTKRRPVIQMSKRYEPIKTWESAKYAADELGITAAHITAVCRGDRQTHGGYRWEYVS